MMGEGLLRLTWVLVEFLGVEGDGAVLYLRFSSPAFLPSFAPPLQSLFGAERL